MIKSFVRIVKPAIVKTNGVIRDLLHPGTVELDIFDSKASIEPSKPMNEEETGDNESTDGKDVNSEDHRIKNEMEKPFLMNIHSSAAILSNDSAKDLQRVNSECTTSTRSKDIPSRE